MNDPPASGTGDGPSTVQLSVQTIPPAAVVSVLAANLDNILREYLPSAIPSPSGREKVHVLSNAHNLILAIPKEPLNRIGHLLLVNSQTLSSASNRFNQLINQNSQVFDPQNLLYCPISGQALKCLRFSMTIDGVSIRDVIMALSLIHSPDLELPSNTTITQIASLARFSREFGLSVGLNLNGRVGRWVESVQRETMIDLRTHGSPMVAFEEWLTIGREFPSNVIKPILWWVIFSMTMFYTRRDGGTDKSMFLNSGLELGSENECILDLVEFPEASIIIDELDDFHSDTFESLRMMLGVEEPRYSPSQGLATSMESNNRRRPRRPPIRRRPLLNQTLLSRLLATSETTPNSPLPSTTTLLAENQLSIFKLFSLLPRLREERLYEGWNGVWLLPGDDALPPLRRFMAPNEQFSLQLVLEAFLNFNCEAAADAATVIFDILFPSLGTDWSFAQECMRSIDLYDVRAPDRVLAELLETHRSISKDLYGELATVVGRHRRRFAWLWQHQEEMDDKNTADQGARECSCGAIQSDFPEQVRGKLQKRVCVYEHLPQQLLY